MSGDVQPRKRKDKKKKKDDLGAEEPRGTAAALGEGDVFMHSYHDHGTGGHWCAKIIFFSLLAVLVTLIGLIILENRGLTELEANSVESQYSGVLEGWIEDSTDDHHDGHTLELKHHDDDEDHTDDHIDENEVEEESLEEEIDHNDDDDESDDDEDHSDEIEDDDEEDETQNDDDDEEDESQNDDDDESQNYDDEEDESQNDDNENGIANDDDGDEIQNDDNEKGDTYNAEDESQEDVSDEQDDRKYEEEIAENIQDHEDEEETNEHYSHEEIPKSDNDIDENDDEDDDVEEQKHDYLRKEMTSHYNYDSYENNNDDESNEIKNEDGNESNEQNIEDEATEDDDDDEQEIEKIEKEVIDGDDSEEISNVYASISKEQRDASKEKLDKDTSNEDDEPSVEKISPPEAGKPFVEIEEETPIKPVDTLAEEEAYERQQEELRRQEEEAPHSLWLKLCVGGALLAATHALVRRATRPDAPEPEESFREETPSLTDRRMTIIDEPVSVTQTLLTQAPREIFDEEVFKRPFPVAQSAPITKPKVVEEKAKEVVAKVLEVPKSDAKKEEEKELHSEEEEEEEEDEDVEEENEVPQKLPEKNQQAEESEPEPEEVSDVEIIYDETLEEEEIPEEEIEEEEISDVDDTELLSRLEAKYGRLPEPERPGQYKGGGNSLEAEWPGEPSDPYWREQLDTAEEEFRQGASAAAAARAGGAGLAQSARARWLRARALDRDAESRRDNRVLTEAIAAYLHLLKMNEALSDERLLEVARRTIDRIQFRGTYLSAEPVYRLLIRRFPDDVNYRNNLTISFLMANRADLADEVLKETLRLWPDDRVALAHRGFVLKIHHNQLEEAVQALRKALDGDAGKANEPRFYYHLGDALLMLGRFDEAREVHQRGAELGHFLSPSQRSLYNVPRLRSRPWWRVEDTPYVRLAEALEASWRDILKEGEAAVALYEQEKEGLKESGEWSQLDIFVRGREVDHRCARTPAVCAALRGAREGGLCRRGQVKFSMMAPGTHVRPHVGPTNCRLRMHLALSNTEGTYIRVDEEIRQWQLGKTLIFDDSFEHEVWHNGTGTRLVLIVDVWHPDLTPAERRQLPAI